jgi:deoxyribodipyrimidine photo-lyase
MTIRAEQVRALNEAPPRDDGDYVLYWMQQSQREAHNPALEWAIGEANDRGLPVVVAFGLADGRHGFPEANARHYAFLLEGMAEVAQALEERGIAFVMRAGQPDALALELAERAALVVCDRGYLTIQRRWRERVAEGAKVAVVQIEGDVVVPVETASPKHESAARTLRPKLHKLWDEYLQPLRRTRPKHPAEGLALPKGLDPSRPEKVLASLSVDASVGPVRRFRGGTSAAEERLRAILSGPIDRYEAERNRPEAGVSTHLSPYLHFGQISPVAAALAVREAKRGGAADKAALLEELIVRRELAMNHVFYQPAYDTYEAVPEWARKTLHAHAEDERPHLYTRAELEEGRTHEPYWNAAMREMRETGYMHNQLRMYWGKKVLHWSKTPEAAYETLLSINNKWFIDGRDANSFTNVAWVFGLHDRPWANRPIFGTVRYQSENSLRKFDAKAYVREVERLCAAER